jgi:hypothetical protein
VNEALKDADGKTTAHQARVILTRADDTVGMTIVKP